MSITTTILGGITILVPIAFFIWLLDKRAEERANTRHAELVTHFGTFAAILLQGQTHIQTQIINLQESQNRILSHLTRMETEWTS